MAASGPLRARPGRVLAMAVVLAALAITRRAGAAPAPADSAPDAPHHSCSLRVVGRGDGSTELADLQLECSPPPAGDGAAAALAPPLTVAVNESLVPQQFIDSFKGVSVVSDLDCRRAAASPTNGNAPRFPLISFCGDYGVRFDRPVIQDVRLPAEGPADNPTTRTGVLLFGGGVRAVLSGADISDNAVSAVVLAVGPASSVCIEASTVARNRGWDGTGVMAFNGSHVEISGGSAFVDNTAGIWGGAVSAWGNGTSLVISGGSAFVNNTASEGGGAVDVSDGTSVSITNSTFIGNQVLNGSGGAVSAMDPGTSLAIGGGSAFANNTARGWGGGAVAVSQGADITITGSSFTGNQALNASGGAVTAWGHGTSLAIGGGSAFLENTASKGAGAVIVSDGTSASITNGSFTGNQALNASGGAVAAWGHGTSLAIGSGSTFASNTARVWGGGAVALHQGANITINGSSFTGNQALSGFGGAVSAVDRGTSLAIGGGSTFANNTARGWDGGAVAVSQGASTTITGSSFTGNQALNASGGAVAAWGHGTSLAIGGGSTFANNTARGWDGGAMAVSQGADITITGSSFTGNQALNASGGAVAAWGNGTSLAIDGGSAFLDNTASKGAGAVVVSNGTSASITNGSFTGNQVLNGSGGAVAAMDPGTSLAIDGGSAFANNTARGWDGGAMAVSQGADITITGSSFTGNQALNASGGAVAAWGNGTSLAIDGGSAFLDNTASKGAGAVVVSNGTSASITNGSFTGNQVLNGSGGAVSAAGRGTTVAIGGGSAFVNNRANTGGAAVTIFNGANVSISKSSFTGNQALNASGGAVLATDLGTTVAIGGGSAFVNNTARDWNGGAVAVSQGADITITGSSFTGNQALNASGGALAAGGNGTSLAIGGGSAFINNTARRAGGAVFVRKGAEASIANSRFMGNIAGWTGSAMAAVDNGTRLAISGSTFANNTVGGWGSLQVVALDGANSSIAESANFKAPEAEQMICAIGEELKLGEGNKEVGPHCQPCPAFQYSLEAGRKALTQHYLSTEDSQCKPCNTSAYCPGGAVIVAQDGFWQGDGTEGCTHCGLDNIVRCASTKACKHNATELAKQHKHRDSNGPLSLLIRPTNNNPDNYSQQLCTVTPPAYTGVLCGACRKPLYGQTAPFTCYACLGVDEGQGNDTINSAGIVALFSTYALCFVAFVLFTTGTTLMENAASRDDVSSHPNAGRSSKGGKAAVNMVLQRSASSSTSSARSSIGDEVDSKMHVMHVVKALVMYAQYARIFINLPISWWPEPLGEAADAVSSASDDRLATQYWSWLLGWPASLDCLFAAAHLDLGIHQAGVKNLINLLAPLALFAAATACQAAWWIARQRVGGWLGRATTARAVPVWAKEWLRRASERLGKRVSLREYLRQHTIVTALVTIFWWYPTIAGVAMGSFACVSVCPTAEAVQGDGNDTITLVTPAGPCVFWAMDMTQACPLHDVRSPSFGWAVGVGVPAWLLCVAVPVMIVALLSRAAEEGRLEEGDFIERFAFLYLDYRFGGSERPVHLPRWLRGGCSACWRPCIGGCACCCSRSSSTKWPATRGTAADSSSWDDLGAWLKRRLALVWNAVIHFQTLLLVALSVYGSLMHEYHQAVCMAVMLVCYLLLVVWLRPFRALAIQRLQALLLAVLCATATCMQMLVRPDGLDARQADDLAATQAAIRWILLLTNVLFVLFTLTLLIVCLVRLVRELRKQQAQPVGMPPGGKQGPLGGNGGNIVPGPAKTRAVLRFGPRYRAASPG